MEYVYAAMLIHKAGKDINEENMKKVLEAVGVSPDSAKIKALVASLEGVNIDEVVKNAQTAQVVAAPAQGGEAKKEEKKKEEEKKPSVEEAAAGLGALFG